MAKEWFSPAPERPPEIEIPDVDLPTRCGAKSKRTGKPCRQRPLASSTRCRMHGGYNYGKPKIKGKQSGKSTYLENSKYVPKALLPAIAAKIEQLKTVEGRTLDALCRAAEIAKRAEALPENAETLDLYLRADAAQSRDIGQAHEFEKKEAPPAQAPTLVINTHQDANQSFWSRDSDGSPCFIQPLGDKLYMLDEATGALWPVVRQLDKETNAELFVKLLSTSAE